MTDRGDTKDAVRIVVGQNKKGAWVKQYQDEEGNEVAEGLTSVHEDRDEAIRDAHEEAEMTELEVHLARGERK